MEKIKINRINPNDVKPVFINDFAVGHNDDTFYLIFSQVDPPNSPPPEIEAIQQAKFIITPRMAEQILTALAINITSFKKEKDTGIFNQPMGSA